MVDAEPILNARTSITRILGAVEQAVSRRPDDHSGQNAEPTSTILSTNQPGIDSRNSGQVEPSHETMFTSMENDFIYLSDRHTQAAAALQSQEQFVPSAESGRLFEMGTTMADPMSVLDFDVLTTDLYNFFPIQTPRPDMSLTTTNSFESPGKALPRRHSNEIPK